jgi:hypothetical protein
VDIPEIRGRKAPYAPISALREFFARIKNVGVPGVVDRKFIQKLNVASNNEWALLSALKFLGIIDDRGEPTSAYRSLQSDRFEETLRHLVETAYAPLLEIGGLAMSIEDLENYFRVTSSPSQAKNAARFFRELTRLSGIVQARPMQIRPVAPVPSSPPFSAAAFDAAPALPEDDDTRSLVLRAKASLVQKLPAPRADWTAAEYEAICKSFLQMLEHLDGPDTAE